VTSRHGHLTSSPPGLRGGHRLRADRQGWPATTRARPGASQGQCTSGGFRPPGPTPQGGRLGELLRHRGEFPRASEVRALPQLSGRGPLIPPGLAIWKAPEGRFASSPPRRCTVPKSGPSGTQRCTRNRMPPVLTWSLESAYRVARQKMTQNGFHLASSRTFGQ
jgi:hypothetical protein